MDERLPFGSVLKRLRLAAGLTHEALAERASLGARTISDLERGVSRSPRADTLALLVEALGLPPDQRAHLVAAARPQADAVGGAPPSPSPSRLPVALTSFIGREQEAADIRTLLRRDDVRLITLTGPGGVGKTRLALHVAVQLDQIFTDGVFAVDLALLTDRDGVCEAIGRALGTGDDGRPPLARLIAALGQKRILLLLDNFEHLLVAAPLVTDLLRACPHLRVLATSRAPLRLSGEQEFPVLPLPVPDSAKHLAIEAVAAYAAVALFVERAARVRPDLTLAADNAATIAAICALLDGLPLAIELAAARVRALPPRTLLERLRHTANMPTLGLLTDGLRDAPNRQQTLRDTIAWSYALLSDEEQRLFRRLAVFADGCSLEAAEAICASMRDSASGDEPRVVAECSPKIHVLETLHSLVEKNLLSRAIGPDGAPRFRMLETIRAYASEMLAVSGEEGTLRRRHAQYYLEIVEAMGALLFATPGTQARLAAEHGNVQAALQWLVQHG